MCQLHVQNWTRSVLNAPIKTLALRVVMGKIPVERHAPIVQRMSFRKLEFAPTAWRSYKIASGVQISVLAQPVIEAFRWLMVSVENCLFCVIRAVNSAYSK